ncbi:MAG: sigma-54-dependent Fis family transcriptional regulator [Alphaproteobacteria bacterium]|nr:sigma-54-dependent Fis family transcriptional regulator [Alphaproteobacteria bacterium]
MTIVISYVDEYMAVHNKFVDIVVIDDENDICEMVSGILEDNGYNVRCSNCYVDAVQLVEDKVPQIIIIDVWINDSERDGLRLLQYVKENYPDVVAIMMSGHGTIATAVEAIKSGAYDFIEKPFDASRLLVSIEKAIEISKLKSENDVLKLKAKVTDNILGDSSNIKEIKKNITQFAKLNTRCSIIAPRGADKDNIAKEIHNLSPRSQAMFCAINCFRRNPQQLEMDLFGSEIVVDGTTQIIRGLFEKANGGTLFIDNMDLIPLDLQTKIVSVFINNKFYRVGNKNNPLQFNVRIIAGLPLNINELLLNKSFNQELFYRVNINTINVLPLNKRVQDIPYILQHYLDQVSNSYHLGQLTLSSEAIELLKLYKWPGDMLEMKYMVDWILSNILLKETNKNIIYADDLPSEVVRNNIDDSFEIPFMAQVSHLGIKEAKESFEKEYFKNQLQKFAGNVSKVSRFTGMERSALYRKLKQLNITGN